MTLTKYEQVMERVRVTEDARSRVLTAMRAPQPSIRFPARRWLTVAACLALLLVSALALPRFLTPAEEPSVQVVPDIVSYDSAGELSQAVGFPVEEPSVLPFAPEETAYTAYWGELAEVICTGQGQTAVLRKTPGADDPSGDYNSYPEETTLTTGGHTATLKGTNGSYVLAVWTGGGYAWSLSLSQGQPAGEWETILSSIP